MIEAPCSRAISDADSAIAADVTALTATVATNTSAIAAKTDGTVLAIAESVITTHTGQIVSLNKSYNNLGNSFYTKVLNDALLAGKENNLSNNEGGGIWVAKEWHRSQTTNGNITFVNIDLVRF